MGGFLNLGFLLKKRTEKGIIRFGFLEQFGIGLHCRNIPVLMISSSDRAEYQSPGLNISIFKAFLFPIDSLTIAKNNPRINLAPSFLFSFLHFLHPLAYPFALFKDEETQKKDTPSEDTPSEDIPSVTRSEDVRD